MAISITMVALATAVLVIAASQAESQTDSTTPKLGQVIESVTQAATVVETVHYQAALHLTCFGNGCAGDFPRPGAERRLNITRVACQLAGATNMVALHGLNSNT